MADIRTDAVSSLPEPLTDREQEILTCLFEGLSNQEIANRFYLSVKTIRWYNSQIYGKLGVNNREAALAVAEGLGLIKTISDAAAHLAAKTNLPLQTTPFIGRQQELVDLARLIADSETRLVTILAPGGMGKTRLALTTAERQLRHFTDGVFFVALAPLSSPNDIVTTIAENVGFSFYGSNSPKQQLLDYFRERHTLLVLDNFEHLLIGASLVTDIVQAAPQIKVLVTSREKLNLTGETLFALSGLHFPDWEKPDDALNHDAVKLFMQSACRIRPDFALHQDDLDYLARICRLTAGMPLALVLAAGWIDVLSLAQIAAEIQQGIDILETDMRDVPERHRSVRATFERTWDRLAEGEQAIFGRLSVFRGGFTLVAAQAAAGASARHLRGLAQKALIQTESHERFAIHELLRQFGAGKLAETDELPAIQARHAAFFTAFMAERKQDMRTTRQLEALALIDPDFENVRTAWLCQVKQQAWEQFPAFLHSLWYYCQQRSRGQELLDLLEQAVHALQAAAPSTETELALGRVLARLGWAYNDIGFPEKSAATTDEAIRILRQHDSPDDLLAALFIRPFASATLNQPDAGLQATQEGIRIARSIDDKYWERWLLVFSGWASAVLGDFEQARQFAEQGLAVMHKLGVRDLIGTVHMVLGLSQLGQEHYEEAKHSFEQAKAHSHRFGHAASLAMFNTYLGETALAQQDYASARAYLRQGLQIYWDTGRLWLTPWPIVFIAQTFVQQHDAERAIEILATIQQHLIPLRNTDHMAAALHEDLEARLEPERFAAAWARGELRELGTLVVELLAELAEK